MKETYKFQKNYKDEATLRKGFNDVVGKTFSLSFESWYQNGYWSDRFNPHTLFDGNKAVANISTYEMTFDWDGKIRHYVQLGGVATDETCRNQGLSRYIMEKVLEEYQGKVDGIFLMANDSVLDFYPKFGFQKRIEWRCSKEVHITSEMTAKPVPMTNRQEWSLLERAVEASCSNSVFELKNDVPLIMFYVTQFMQGNVYYIEEMDAYVIAEIKEDKLLVYGVYTKERADLDKVYQAFGKDIRHVTLLFTPFDKENYVQEEIHDADDTLFMIGKEFEDFSEQKIMFPVLSHT